MVGERIAANSDLINSKLLHSLQKLIGLFLSWILLRPILPQSNHSQITPTDRDTVRCVGTHLGCFPPRTTSKVLIICLLECYR